MNRRDWKSIIFPLMYGNAKPINEIIKGIENETKTI